MVYNYSVCTHDIFYVLFKNIILYNYEIKLIFSGNAAIKVIVELIEVKLDDQGDFWESKNKPKHNFFDD